MLVWLLLVFAMMITAAGVVRCCVRSRRTRPSHAAGPSPALAPLLAFLLTAAVLFWLWQTGAERRLLGPAALFRFFEDGAPDTGRALALLACVLLSAGLWLTDAGDALRRALRELFQKRGMLWAASLCVTALFFLWSLRITVMSFMTSDEKGILTSIVSAAAQGRAAANTFSNVLFCGLIGLFYRLYPDGHWYTLYHLAAMLASLVILGRCILVKTEKRGWPLLCGCCLHFLVCAGLFMYSFAKISFTVTPAIVGAASVALVLCRGDAGGRGERAALDVVSVALLVLCFWQRRSTGLCVLCFWGLACAYQLVSLLRSGEPRRFRQMLGLGGCIAAAALLIIAGKLVSRTGAYSANSDLWTAESYRSLIMDYLIDDLTEEQFEAVGIPPELSTLLRGWYFMDERITTDAFRELASLYYEANPAESVAEDPAALGDYLAGLYAAVRNDPQMLWRMLCAFALTPIPVLSFLLYSRRSWLEALCAVCALGGALLLNLYLVIEGRFPTRVFLVVILPALVCLLLMALAAPDEPAPPAGGRVWFYVTAGCFFAAFAVCCAVSLTQVPLAKTAAGRADLFAEEWAVDDAVTADPDVLFITNIYDGNLDPWHSSRYPANLRLWGNGGDTYRSDRLYGPDFFREDVRFLCKMPAYVTFLMQYLTLDNGPVQAVRLARLTDTVVIYDLSQVTPGDGYTGWYEQNGLTYYFENGRALTGTQTIDGVAYEFAPVGRDAETVIVPDGENTIYTTTAFALMEGEP